jgi:hypothetical protein
MSPPAAIIASSTGAAFPAALNEQRPDDTRQRDARTRREVDAAAHDDHGHPERADRHDDGLRKDDFEIPVSEENLLSLVVERHRQRKQPDHENQTEKRSALREDFFHGIVHRQSLTRCP